MDGRRSPRPGGRAGGTRSALTVGLVMAAAGVAGGALSMKLLAPSVPEGGPAGGAEADRISGVVVPVPEGAGPPAPARTRVVLLGTGTPNADPERWGPATAVVVDGRAYLVDAGPGVVRRAAAAARDRGVEALRAERLGRVFLTHLHSDHTVGLPDLLLSPWVLDRAGPLEVYGPPGTAAMMERIVEAWRADVDVRLHGGEPRDANRTAYRPVVHEIGPGPVYEDDRVRVTALPVRHGSWPEAYGYRFEGPDRAVVVSGDAAPSEALVAACDGCDVLVHEVYSAERFAARPPEWQRYHRAFHTSTVELAELAARARPKLLVLTHLLLWGTDEEGLVREMREAGYEGRVVVGRDLEVW